MVYFVGAGCGAADLITVRGMHLLGQADIIIYAGSLINPELLKYAKSDCEIYNSAVMTLEEVMDVMLGARENQCIVRLHTGDASVYGAVREQMDILDQYQIPYESCPGVSACFGAAASLNLEYTLPGVSQSLILTRMEGRTRVPERESIESLAGHHASMAIYLSAGRLAELCERLIAGGYEEDTPAALVYKATWPQEEAYVSTLAELPQIGREHQITKTALVLVGDAVAHRHYDRSRLYAPDFETEYRTPQKQNAFSVICFTRRGETLARTVAECIGEYQAELFTKYSGENAPGFSRVDEPLETWAGRQFAKKTPILFIGACGIAIRAIAPSVRDKLTDSPVLVMDEAGTYVIPILSGHMGGANEIAQKLAAQMGAAAVITTATDINQTFEVDLFAKENALSIENRGGIAKVSAKVLDGETVTVTAEPAYAPKAADIVIAANQKLLKPALLWLAPKEYVIGFGCRKGKSMEEVEAFIAGMLDRLRIRLTQVAAIASIEQKRMEPCLLQWSQKTQIPFVTFSGEELAALPGDFHGSDFVKKSVGCDNVCERAAVAACGGGGRLVMGKCAENGMTIAVAKMDWSKKNEA